MKKKVMLIVPMLHQGGFERVCVTTARLLESYADIVIVVFDSANIAYDVEGLTIIDIGLGVKAGKLGKILQVIRRTLKVRSLKKKITPHVAYSFGPTANIVNAFSKTRQTKVWLGLRGYTDLETPLKVKIFVRLADTIICCSKVIEEELRNTFHAGKTTAIYNPFNVKNIKKEAAKQEPELPWDEKKPWNDNKLEDEEPTYLVSMGRVDDLKGFWHVLKVFAMVRESIPAVRLLILGQGDFTAYHKLAEDLGITDNFYFAGMQNEPYKYLKKGSIYLLTSSNEGFPNALVEGMALGLAAVSVDCKSGPAEILLEAGIHRKDPGRSVVWGEYGVLIPDMGTEKNMDAAYKTKEEKEMADVVVKLLSDRALLEKYQKAAAERAEMFTYDNYIRQMLLLLASSSVG